MGPANSTAVTSRSVSTFLPCPVWSMQQTSEKLPHYRCGRGWMETSQADFKRTVASLQSLPAHCHTVKERQNGPEHGSKANRTLYGGLRTPHPCIKDKDTQSHHVIERKTLVWAGSSGKKIGHLWPVRRWTPWLWTGSGPWHKSRSVRTVRKSALIWQHAASFWGLLYKCWPF